MERESILFYRSFYEVTKDLPKEDGEKFLHAVLDYAFYGIEPELQGIPAAFFKLVRPQIDANNRKYENGKKGGRPKKEETESVNESDTQSVNDSDSEAASETTENPKPQVNTEVFSDLETENKPSENQKETKIKPNENQKETKEKPKENQKETKEKPNENQTETKPKPNDNVNVNDNVNYYDNENLKENVNDSKEKIKQKEKSGDFSVCVSETISYMNEKCGTTFDPGKKEYRERIQKRIDDGYTFEDLRKVIDKKSAEWLGTPMQRHLNPHTLFKADKFDIYLHSPASTIMRFPDKGPKMMTAGTDYGSIESKLLEN